MHEVISTREIRVRLVIRFTIFNLSLFADRSGIDKQKSLLKNIVLYIFERACIIHKRARGTNSVCPRIMEDASLELIRQIRINNTCNLHNNYFST